MSTPPPRPALLLAAYLAGAPVAYGVGLVGTAFDDDSERPITTDQYYSAVQTGTSVAVVVAAVGAVVILTPWLRSRLGIRSWGRVALVDATVCIGMIVGFVVGLPG